MSVKQEMPSIRYMNTPNHPFWDFVQEMNNRPQWGGPPPPPPHQQAQADVPRTEPEAGPATNEKDTAPEDPPEVDPATVRSPQETRDMPFRGRGRCGGRDRHNREERQAHREERHAAREERRAGRHSPEGRCGRGDRPRRGEWTPFGGAPFGFGHGFWPGGPGHEHHGPPGHGPPGHGPPGHGPPGPGDHPHPHPHHHEGPWGGPRGGRGGWGARGGPHRGPHHGPHGPGARDMPPAFDPRGFLKVLGERIGMDLTGAAESLGIERFWNSDGNADTDFEPKTDIFERAGEYIVHVSLPGAKKEDVGVDWDGENSVLRVAGVVHRPGVDEEMLQQLTVDGRKKEVGVFEKSIKLGTRDEPANIDVPGIKAKMVDGVLVVRVPRLEIEHQKRDVPISSAYTTPSPQRTGTTTVFDADHEIEMRDAEAEEEEEEEEVEELPVAEKSKPITTEKGKAKEAEYQQEKEQQQQHATTSATAINTEEPLPVYQAYTPTVAAEREESDWENYGSEEEGEYVKINVD